VETLEPTVAEDVIAEHDVVLETGRLMEWDDSGVALVTCAMTLCKPRWLKQ